ncbi:hypothetical protein [Streptomyces sp. NPDC047042]|uniref:hypothetical protein n=1 Tax=Streptomyces sp. NPDC047042 TaxID=3154807 RepID=UPI0033DA4BC9
MPSSSGRTPVPPTAGTHPALIVVDDLAESWVMEFDVWHNQVRHHITGFSPSDNWRSTTPGLRRLRRAKA